MRSLQTEIILYDIVHQLKHELELADGVNNSGFIRHMLYKDETNQVKVHIYKEDNHKRPHIHLYYKNDYEASVCIKTGEILAGSMPKKYLKPISKWQIKNSVFLLEQWQAVQNGEKPIELST